MNIGILGSGMVGKAIGSKLVSLGHSVTLGSRSAANPDGLAWAQSAGERGSCATFAEAAKFGEILFNCTNGARSLDALALVGAEALSGKVLVDVSNPLDLSPGSPGPMAFCNTDSLGERIQREYPDSRVVKALNTMNCQLMVNAALVPGDHHLFLCGNDAAAKAQMTALFGEWFGWRKAQFLDLGDITAARGTEMVLPLWLRLWGTLGHPRFNFQIVSGQ